MTLSFEQRICRTINNWLFSNTFRITTYNLPDNYHAISLLGYNYKLGDFVIYGDKPKLDIPYFLRDNFFIPSNKYIYSLNVIYNEPISYSSLPKIPCTQNYCFKFEFRKHIYYVFPGFIFDENKNILMGAYKPFTLDNDIYKSYKVSKEDKFCRIIKINQSIFNSKGPLEKILVEHFIPFLNIDYNPYTYYHKIQIVTKEGFGFNKNYIKDSQTYSLEDFNKNANILLKLAINSSSITFKAD